MGFPFVAVATIHGVIAILIIPARIATGGEPYRMLCQYKGCGRKQYSSTKVAAMTRIAVTASDGSPSVIHFPVYCGTGR